RRVAIEGGPAVLGTHGRLERALSHGTRASGDSSPRRELVEAAPTVEGEEWMVRAALDAPAGAKPELEHGLRAAREDVGHGPADQPHTIVDGPHRDVPLA